MIKYVFRDSPVAIKNAAKADPQKIGEALAKIADGHEGELRPRDVVEAARNKRSPLHRHFEWNDVKAAEAYRLDQAREVIRVVRVESEDGKSEPVRAFLSVSDKGGASYRTLADVQSSAYLQTIVKRQALRELEAFQRRYRDLSEICSFVRAASEKLRAEVEHNIESRAA